MAEMEWEADGKSIVTLNVFQHPFRLSARIVISPWTLKQVQGDEDEMLQLVVSRQSALDEKPDSRHSRSH